MKQDALVQFEMVLEKEPDNVDALNYVINISYSRGQLPEALQFVNLALRRSPNNKELLGKKLGILETMENYGQAAAIAEQLYKENPSPAGKEHMLELRNISARNYMADLEYDSALVCYNSILAYDRSNMQAINGLVSIYAQQKKYDDALHTIDEALKLYPDNEQLLYRKAGVLDAYTHYTEAAQISKKLIEKHPKNKYYIAAFVEQTLSASRLSMQMEDYVITVHILKQALDMQPDNLDALNYIINLELSLKQYDSALYYVNEGIHYYPDSKDFVFKKALVYAEAKQFKAAYAISGGLYNAYPYNNRFKSAYVDHLLGSGRQFMNNDQPDSALVEFNKALAISPNDTVTLFYTINLLNDGKQFDEALALIEQGRQLYPTHPYFLLKRAVVLESQKQYEAAYRAMDTLSKAGQMDQKYIDYKELLYSKQLRNELGLLYLNSTFDPTTIVGDNSIRRIATIQYSHRFDNGSVTTRINYAGRITGSGYQVELEGTLNHSAKWYSWATSGVSNPNSIFPNTNLVFPPLRLGYSLFHALPKGYDLELGIRFVKLDSDKTYSGVFGLSKEWKDFYFTGHLYETQLNHLGITAGPYPSYSLSTKYFVKDDHTSFITALIGYGSAPDDISRILQIGYKTILYKTISVGAGYTMQLHYRTTLGINYSWFNIQYHASTGPGDLDGYKNQYDLFLVLSHKF